jgi:hypothetical protein
MESLGAAAAAEWHIRRPHGLNAVPVRQEKTSATPLSPEQRELVTSLSQRLGAIRGAQFIVLYAASVALRLLPQSLTKRHIDRQHLSKGEPHGEAV